MGVTVFGTQPFVQLAAGFQTSAEELDALGATLGTMGDALERNGDDLAAIRSQLDRLADEIEELAVPTDMPPIVPAATALFLLLALQSAGLVAAGLALSRLDARSAAGAAGQ